jgi:hypothetical protein
VLSPRLGSSKPQDPENARSCWANGRAAGRDGNRALAPTFRALLSEPQPNHSRSAVVPARRRTTEASLRQRLESLRAENQRLREENAGLKNELAIAYGAGAPHGAD